MPVPRRRRSSSPARWRTPTLEGFGLTALEALACSTPTVVSRIPPFTEHFADGEVQWADPLDPASIAAALQRAIDGGRQAPPPVVGRFDWAASAARHEQLYRQFLRSF